MATETAGDPCIHPTMYSNKYEEMLCLCADSNGLGIRKHETADGNEYELTAGLGNQRLPGRQPEVVEVTGWDTETIREWAEDLLSHCEADITRMSIDTVRVTVTE